MRRTPLVFEEFKNQGNFVISRTRNVFSAMGLDQRHEQLNKDVKGDREIVGLTEDEDKLRHWSICSPGVSRVVSEFEKNTVLEPKIHTKFHHHEDSESFKARFAKHVSDLKKEFVNLGNPFLGDSTDLTQLGTEDVIYLDVVCTVRNIE